MTTPRSPRHPAALGRLACALLLAAVAGATAAPAADEVPAVTGSRKAPVPAWDGPLPYPVVIADRRNNRLLEVTPDKRVIWRFDSPDLKVYHGNDDVYFGPDGTTLWISEEDNYDIHGIDYARRQLIWSYGVPDEKGSKPGYLDFPDDTHLLDDGQVVTADIRNCRILFIERGHNAITQQWGQPGRCRHDPPRSLDLPNGVTPYANGDLLVTEIRGAWLSRLTRTGGLVWTAHVPLQYPSDAFPTTDEKQIVVADYAKPGRVIVWDPATRKVSWVYEVKSGEGMLDHPSIAMELPNGNILLTDDYRHRVVVIDRASRKIVWQYGQTDRTGRDGGLINGPDGLDIDVFHDWKARR